MRASISKKFKKNLGRRIREIRLKQKISQSQLAFESGLSREEIYRLELGYKNITIDTLLKIALALDAKMSDIINFEIEENHF